MKPTLGSMNPSSRRGRGIFPQPNAKTILYVDNWDRGMDKLFISYPMFWRARETEWEAASLFDSLQTFRSSLWQCARLFCWMSFSETERNWALLTSVLPAQETRAHCHKSIYDCPTHKKSQSQTLTWKDFMFPVLHQTAKCSQLLSSTW